MNRLKYRVNFVIESDIFVSHRAIEEAVKGLFPREAVMVGNVTIELEVKQK